MCKPPAQPAHSEEPQRDIDLETVAGIIVGSIIKRAAYGRDNGVALVAEGIAERLDPEMLKQSSNTSLDAYGHVQRSDIPLGWILRDRIRQTLESLKISTTVVAKDIGYELRCAKPVPFDVEYTRTLGYGAVRYLLNGGSGALIAITGGRVTPVNLRDLQDPETGRIRVRMVDVATESFEVARSYMIRLEPSDFREPERSKLAAQANLSPIEFEERFLPAVKATTPSP